MRTTTLIMCASFTIRVCEVQTRVMTSDLLCSVDQVSSLIGQRSDAAWNILLTSLTLN